MSHKYSNYHKWNQVNRQAEENNEPAINETETTETTNETEVEETPVIIRGVVTNCVKLNVRKMPAANAGVVCVIDVSAEVTIDEENSTDEFYRVCTTSGIEGFCMKKYISIQQ